MIVFGKIAEIIKKHPWAVIIACLAVTVFMGLGMLFLTGHVSYNSLLPQDFPSVKALSSLRQQFGGISYEYVLLRAPDVTDNKIVQALIGLDDSLSKDPRFNSGQLESRKDASGAEVPVVQDYITPFAATMQREMAMRGFNIPLSTVTNDMVKQFTGKDLQVLIQEDYLSNPQAAAQVVGRFITPDRKAALIMLKDGADITEKQQVKLGADLEHFFQSKFGTIDGVEVSIAGDATLAKDFNNHIKSKTVLLLVIALVFVIAALFMAFRRISDTVLPIAVMALAVVWTFGFIGWVGVEYSVAVIAVIPLLLGTALTFVVPFVARYYEEAEQYTVSARAVGTALAAVGVAIFLAAITNMFGFLVFEFSILPAVRDFGLICAIGTIFVFILTAVLLPTVIVLRDRVWERRAAAEAGRRKEYFDGLSLRRRRGLFTRAVDRVLDAFTNLATNHSTLLIVIFSILILAGLVQIRGLTTDSDLRKLVPRGLPGMSANFEVEKYFGGHQMDVIMVKGDVLSPQSLKAMADLEGAITSGADAGGLYSREGVTGLPDALAAANNGKLPATREEAQQALKNAEENGGYVVGGLLGLDGKSALITLNAGGAQTSEVVDEKMALLRKESKRLLNGTGLTFTLGGITPLTKDMTKNIIPTETLSSGISLALCALILVIIFRSFAYGLITLTVAVAGVSAEVVFLNIVNWPLDIMTSLVSALVIGIGVNFGILFTHRYIQEKYIGEKAPDDAIKATISNLGRANVIAALATVAAFVIVMFSGIVPIRRFGGVTAVAITVCLVTSLTLMPALLYRFSGHTKGPQGTEVSEKDIEPQTV
jgi:uncharacterized protein